MNNLIEYFISSGRKSSAFGGMCGVVPIRAGAHGSGRRMVEAALTAGYLSMAHTVKMSSDDVEWIACLDNMHTDFLCGKLVQTMENRHLPFSGGDSLDKLERLMRTMDENRDSDVTRHGVTDTKYEMAQRRVLQRVLQRFHAADAISPADGMSVTDGENDVFSVDEWVSTLLKKLRREYVGAATDAGMDCAWAWINDVWKKVTSGKCVDIGRAIKVPKFDVDGRRVSSDTFQVDWHQLFRVTFRQDQYAARQLHFTNMQLIS